VGSLLLSRRLPGYPATSSEPLACDYDHLILFRPWRFFFFLFSKIKKNLFAKMRDSARQPGRRPAPRHLTPVATVGRGKAGKRTMSAAARRKIAVSQRVGWAKIRAAKK
jgi:hypothetical protein